MKKDISEIIKKLHKIRIKARIESENTVAGLYHSTFKGQGISFSEVREYVYGDDVKDIDWNVTARMNSPYVKIFEEDREQTFVVIADISGSALWSSYASHKREVMTYMAGHLLYSALLNNDRISAILFSSEMEKYIPPSKGINHFMKIIRDIYMLEPKYQSTDIHRALSALLSTIKKKSFILMISDFIDGNIEQKQEEISRLLGMINKKHFFRVIVLNDRYEEEPLPYGVLNVKDRERGGSILVDFSSSKNREIYLSKIRKHRELIISMFVKNGIKYVEQRTDSPFLKNVIKILS